MMQRLTRLMFPAFVVAIGLSLTGLMLTGCSGKNKGTTFVFENPYNDDPSQQNPSEVIIGRRYLRLINTERVRRGLHILKWSDELATAAARHSEIMSQEKELTDDGLVDVAAEVDFNMTFATASVSKGYDFFLSHRSIMDDEQAREYLLSPELTHLGIGIVESDERQFWLFGDKDIYFTHLYAQNGPTKREIEKKIAWEKFVRQQVAEDKLLINDLNYALFSTEMLERQKNRDTAPGGIEVQIPALEEKTMDYEIFSVKPTPTPEMAGEAMDDEGTWEEADQDDYLPVDIIVETPTPLPSESDDAIDEEDEMLPEGEDSDK